MNLQWFPGHMAKTRRMIAENLKQVDLTIEVRDSRIPASSENPEIKSFPYDFEKSGYCLCVTDTKGSHANLTDDYVAVRSEMESIASQFVVQPCLL